MNIIDNIYNDMKKRGLSGIKKFIDNYDSDDKQITFETILFIAYDLYKYKPEKDVVEKKLKRQYQTKFRKELEKKYKKCIISKRNIAICEACHIVPFCDSDLIKRYDINNGLLLSSDLHKLFDKHMFSIDNNNRIILSNKILKDESYEDYHKYHNKKIELDNGTMKNLKIHYAQFMEKN